MDTTKEHVHPYAVETNTLSKKYGSLMAVDNVDIRVKTGEIYGFLGLNGAGKTTTIRMLLGLIRPTNGNAMLFGRPANPDALDIWAKVGSMVETPHAYPELTVRENLHIVCRLRSITTPRSVIERVVSQMGLEEYLEVKAKHLSLGNKQRLGLAKALIHKPQLLILDEPTNGLDPAGIVEIRHLLRRLSKEEGITLFISSHQLDEISRLADRIGIIHKGRLIQELDAKQIDEELRKTLLIATSSQQSLIPALTEIGCRPEKDSQQAIMIDLKKLPMTQEDLLKHLIRQGIPISDFHVRTESLEDYFLRVIGENDEGHGLNGGDTHA